MPTPTRVRAVATAALVFAALIPSAEAHAQWTYAFNGLFNNGAQQVAFTFESATPIVGPLAATPTSCSITPALFNGETYSCGTSTFNQNGLGTGLDFIDFGFTTAAANSGGAGTGFYFFQAGAFSAEGVYQTVNPDPVSNPTFVAIDAECDGLEEWQCDDRRREFNYFGNAGAATLTVRQTPPTAVPEPSAAVLLAMGLGGLAFAGRRRKLPV